MNVVLFEPAEVLGGDVVRLTGPRARHIREVLRSAQGARVRVGVVDGPLGVGTVLEVSQASVELRCEFEPVTKLPPPVDVLLALPRPKVMRRLWAQLAALGTGHIIVTNASRVERHYFDTHVLAEASYRPLLVEGLQQARDTRLPKVLVRRQLKVLLEDELDTLVPEGLRVLADPTAAASFTRIVRRDAKERLLVAIGPEGGWTDFERDLLAAHGFVPAGVGRRPLRSDTACIALLALAHDALDLRTRAASRRGKPVAGRGPLSSQP